VQKKSHQKYKHEQREETFDLLHFIIKLALLTRKTPFLFLKVPSFVQEWSYLTCPSTNANNKLSFPRQKVYDNIR